MTVILCVCLNTEDVLDIMFAGVCVVWRSAKERNRVNLGLFWKFSRKNREVSLWIHIYSMYTCCIVMGGKNRINH